MKQFLSVFDVPDLNKALDLAVLYQQQPFVHQHLGVGKTLGLVFLNPSLRTRLSTQIAADNLGLKTHVLNIDKDAWQLEFNDGVVMDSQNVEHVKEAAGVLGQYVDILGVRSFPHLANADEDKSEKVLRQFQKYAQKPIVSLESAMLHPLQSFADIVTIRSHKPQNRKPKVVLSWAHHVKALPQAVPQSFAQWINHWGGTEFVVTHPQGYELDERITGKLNVEYDQQKAFEGADFIYVKNWSATQGEHYGRILCSDRRWSISQEHLKHTNNAKIMHCLPVRRNVVIMDDVLDSPASIILEQAKNRICSAQAVLSLILQHL